MEFVEKIGELLKQKGVKKKEFLTDLGLGINAFSYWKNNGSLPNGETLRRIADYFGVTVDYLLGKTDEESPTEEALKVALFGGTGEVTPEMWEEVKQFAEFVKKKHEERNS